MNGVSILKLIIGLLKGKKATCFPGFEKYLDGAQVLLAPVRVVTDGNITTSRGMGTSVDLGLEIVKLLISEEKAKELAASTQYADWLFVMNGEYNGKFIW